MIHNSARVKHLVSANYEQVIFSIFIAHTIRELHKAAKIKEVRFGNSTQLTVICNAVVVPVDHLDFRGALSGFCSNGHRRK